MQWGNTGGLHTRRTFKKMTTIHLHLVEEIDGDYVEVRAPRTGPNAGILTPARQSLAESFGFNLIRAFKALPAADPDSGSPSADLAKLAERIERIAIRKGAKVKRKSPLHWVITRRDTPPRPTYEFPAGSFCCCYQTQWGPTDFYGKDLITMLAAIRSGLDFTTPWLSCKKEILSSQFIRSKGVLTVRVSVSDDFDTPGTGEASGRILANSTDEQINRKLEKLGSIAWDRAERDRKSNQDYVGYSVGPDEEPYPWVHTYLVNAGGCNTPSGDNYHWWGWQEVDTDDFDTPVGIPEGIPADVAEKLAEMMEGFISPAVYGGFRATAWD